MGWTKTGALVVVAVLGAIGALVDGCSGVVPCDCTASDVEVKLSEGNAASAEAVTLSGPACDGVQPTCEQTGAGGCFDYRFAARATGVCHVAVIFANGTFEQDVTFTAASGCCVAPEPNVTVVSAAPVGDAG